MLLSRVKECFPLLCYPLAQKTAFKRIHQSFKTCPARQSQDTAQGKAQQPEPAASQSRAIPREEPLEQQVLFNSHAIQTHTEVAKTKPAALKGRCRPC